MATQEVIARVAMIQKMEADRKGRTRKT